MVTWARSSCAISASAVVAFVAVVCGNAGWLPAAAVPWLQTAAIGTSVAAGLVGAVAVVVLGLRNRTWATLAVTALAVVASLPAPSAAIHVALPAD